MHRENLIRVLVGLVLFFPFLGFGQKVEFKEANVDVPDYLHEYFRPVPDSYVDISYSSTHSAFSHKRNYKKTTVTGYNARLQEIYTTPVKQLAGNRYLGGIEFNKQLHIFYSDNKKIFICELDITNGQVKGAPVELFTATNEPSELIKGFSSDSSLFYIIFKCHTDRGKDEIFEGVVMDKKKGVHTKFSFSLDDVNSYIDKTTCLLSSEGLVYVINAIRVKTSKDDFRPIQYLVTEVSNEGKTATTYIDGFPQGRLSNIVWSVNKSGLHFTGLLAKEEKANFTTILSGEYSSWQKKVTGLKEARMTDIPANAEMINSFKYEDGSVAVVLQPASVTHTYRGNFHYTDSYAGSLYILRVTPDQNASWVKEIFVSQGEPTAPLYTGAIAMQFNNGDLFVFFLDDKDNNRKNPEGKISGVQLGGSKKNIQLVALSIKGDGTITKIGSANSDGEYQLAPHEIYKVYDDEIVYTSYYSKTLGKSRHRLGLIRIR